MHDVIITVHGVGEATPGATLSCLEKSLTAVMPTSYKDAPLVLQGQTYQRRLPQSPGIPELVEVNWADVRKPGHTVFGFLRHLPALAVAALDLDHGWLGRPPAPPRLRAPYVATQWLYGMLLKTFALWAGLPVLLALGATGPSNWNPWTVGLALVALTGLMAWVIRRWGRPIFVAGVTWTLALAGLTLCLFLSPDWAPLDRLSQYSAMLCGGTQLAVAVLLLALGVEVGLAVRRDPNNRLRYLSYLGMNYASLLFLATLGSFLWAIILNALKYGGPYVGRTGDPVPESWSAIFLRYIGYDLRAGEFAMLAATLGTGLLVAVGFAHYWLVLKGYRNGRFAGDIARQWYRRLLVGAPLLLLAPAAALLLTCPLGPFPPDVPALLSYGLVTIYTVSASRLAALLPALGPRVATALAVVGDVVFYTARPGTALSIRETCNGRLRDLLALYAGMGGGRSICVVGHSQGSVIAFEVLSAFPQPQGVTVGLVTMGSPLCTLYRDFLGYNFSARPAPWFAWVNLYRTGDYIGGSVPQLAAGGNDVNLGGGEHTGYWSDPKIVQYL
jgi:hypothetical protein